jgi:hypothetical protein
LGFHDFPGGYNISITGAATFGKPSEGARCILRAAFTSRITPPFSF